MIAWTLRENVRAQLPVSSESGAALGSASSATASYAAPRPPATAPTRVCYGIMPLTESCCENRPGRCLAQPAGELISRASSQSRLTTCRIGTISRGCPAGDVEPRTARSAYNRSMPCSSSGRRTTAWRATPAAMEDHMDYYDLGSYTRKVTTATPEAQLWFDRGPQLALRLQPRRGDRLLPEGAGARLRLRTARSSTGGQLRGGLRPPALGRARRRAALRRAVGAG